MRVASPVIAEAEKGHRRGVVLGLTMAELMLLLLFCLLLVAASLVSRKEAEMADLRRQMEDFKAIDIALRTIAPDMSVPQFPATGDLALALRLILDLKAMGMSPAELRASPLVDLDGKLRLELERLRSLSAPGSAPMPEENWTRLEAARDLIAVVEAGGGDVSALTDQPMAGLMADLSTRSQDHEFLRQIESLLAPAAPPPGAKPEVPASQWPPMIALADDGYSFERGSAEVTSAFRTRLAGETAGEIAALLERYKVDVIEVVGHTDETAINPTRPSNLDRSVIAAANGAADPGDLVPVDNAGLGLARAIAVASVLRASPELKGARVIPYSAAQLVMPGDRLADGSHAGDQRSRRRIEIRVRRSEAAAGHP